MPPPVEPAPHERGMSGEETRSEVGAERCAKLSKA